MKKLLCIILIVAVAYFGYNFAQGKCDQAYRAGYEDGYEDASYDKDHSEYVSSRNLGDEDYGIFNDVMVTPTGECFHKHECYTLANSADKMATSRDDAIEHGYRPCEICNP